jgi:phage tail sheath protein FI
MGFQLSPGVNVTEIDLTTVVPAVSTSTGAIAGVFRWGPVDLATLVDSEINLINRFTKPTNHNPETWFTAGNFLGYGNSLYVVRVANTVANASSTTLTDSPNSVFNSVATTDSTLIGNTVELSSYVVKNRDDYLTKSFPAVGTGGVHYVARFPGDLGDSLKISVCDSANQYTDAITVSNAIFTVGSNAATLVFGSSGSALIGNGQFTVGDYIEAGNSTIGKQILKITSITQATANLNLTLEENFSLSRDFNAVTSVTRYWEFYNVIDAAPGQSEYMASFGNTAANDELHAVVVDQDGKFSGVPGTILEVFANLSRATDAKTRDGATNFYQTVINDGSNYVWWANDRANAGTNTGLNLASSTNSKPLSLSFDLGQDGDDESTLPISTIALGYDLFKDATAIDVSLILQGKARGAGGATQLAGYLIDNLAEDRKDCVVFISPDRADVVNNNGNQVADVVAFRNTLNRSSSYAVMDSGYKYQYDKYNDVYRYIPLNGDIAGLCARTDVVSDPWYSPGGFNRGQIKNLVKLAWNPTKSERDQLYKNGVNPVTSFPGQGTVLFGDKTLLAKPSAFDRINVRRLFIVLEKAIATASKFTLFEFNDEFTSSQFKGLVEPFLRDVQGRRGIYDFRVICDTTNNTGEVIDRNEFVGDIYIKPARSINFIQLNFVAVRTGVEFDEVVGRF